MRRPAKSRTARFTSVPLRQRFFEHVWDITRQIPRGRVTTYGRLASRVGRPPGVTMARFRAAGARWVGQAMAHCPEGVPWHRVINAQGRVSRRMREADEGLQQGLLEAEGVRFDGTGRVDLRLFGWPQHPSPWSKLWKAPLRNPTLPLNNP